MQKKGEGDKRAFKKEVEKCFATLAGMLLENTSLSLSSIISVYCDTTILHFILVGGRLYKFSSSQINGELAVLREL